MQTMERISNQELLHVNTQNNDDQLPAFSLDLEDCWLDGQPTQQDYY